MKDKEIKEKIINSFYNIRESMFMEKENSQLKELSLVKEAIHRTLIQKLLALKMLKKILKMKNQE